MFERLVLFCLCCCRLVDAEKSVFVMEGDSVTLQTDTELQRNDLIMWNFKPKGPLIAKINLETNDVLIKDDVLDGRFRDRLEVNNQTGSLTITNTRTEHTGVYQITISSKTKIIDRFNVTVFARLPVPAIVSEFPDNSSLPGSSRCVLLCSAANVSHVTLSWYKGSSLFSSIGVSDLNSSLSLHLECLDDSYSCVLNNSISNQTEYANITELCQPCSDCAFCCRASEAVPRLVASVLVGVATVFVLVYDIITSRKGQ